LPELKLFLVPLATLFILPGTRHEFQLVNFTLKKLGK